MTKRLIMTACGTALLIAAAVVVALHERQQAPLPDVLVAQTPAEVRVKAVERKPEPSDHEVIEASAAVAIVCGADPTTADRYEARNDALRSIARRRDLEKDDVAAYLVTAKCCTRKAGLIGGNSSAGNTYDEMLSYRKCVLDAKYNAIGLLHHVVSKFGSPCDNEEEFNKLLKLFDEYFKRKAQGGER